jgi:hypothetical protein
MAYIAETPEVYLLVRVHSWALLENQSFGEDVVDVARQPDTFYFISRLHFIVERLPARFAVFF